MEQSDHRARWHDWLQWSNLLQFLDYATGCQALLGSVSTADELLETSLLLDLVAPPSADPDPVPDLADEVFEELDLIEDSAVADLVRAVP